MKLEIIKEEKFNEPTWYLLKADDRLVDCSKNVMEMLQLFDKIRTDPSSLETVKTVLKSEEI